MQKEGKPEEEGTERKAEKELGRHLVSKREKGGTSTGGVRKPKPEEKMMHPSLNGMLAALSKIDSR